MTITYFYKFQDVVQKSRAAGPLTSQHTHFTLNHFFRHNASVCSNMLPSPDIKKHSSCYANISLMGQMNLKIDWKMIIGAEERYGTSMYPATLLHINIHTPFTLLEIVHYEIILGAGLCCHLERALICNLRLVWRLTGK